MTSDAEWMTRAIELSAKCVPSETAYSVGAIIVSPENTLIAQGFSREIGPHDHAEEVALIRATGKDLTNATIYSTLEPCAKRASKPQSCTELIIQSGIRRVVVAWREPSLFVVDCDGVELLRDSNISVAELPELDTAARLVNAHLKLT